MSDESSLTLKKTLERFTSDAATELVRRLDDGRLQCLACGHLCRIAEGHSGVCRVRYVREGTLRRPAGYVAALACDPIEKKPFFHAFPGRDALTFGMLGCDLKCSYCQNWITSQTLRDDDATAPPIPCEPDALVRAAVEQRAAVVASSYNEPLITADWAAEVFRVAQEAGLTCAMVSNGNGTPEVLRFLRPLVSLYKVDLKGFTDKAYKDLGGRLSTILETIQLLKELGFWVEIVTLLVPDFNDSDRELRAMAKFLAGVDPLMPWHVTAFHPDYKMLDRDATAVRGLLRAVEVGRDAGLRYIYAGNRPGQVGDLENTYCHGCGELLIRRRSFLVEENRMQGESCPACGQRIPGQWEPSPPRRTPGLGRPKPVRL